jgi:hypothetical protein
VVRKGDNEENLAVGKEMKKSSSCPLHLSAWATFSCYLFNDCDCVVGSEGKR